MRPTNLTPEFPATIPHAVKWMAQQYRDLPYICDPFGAVSFTDMEARSAALARGLVAAGIGKGTHVGLVMPNGGDFAVALFALLRVGAVAVLMSTMAKPREMAHMIRHADLDTLLIVDSYLTNDYVDVLEKALPSLAGASSARPLRLLEAPFLRSIWMDGDWANGNSRPSWSRGTVADLTALAGNNDGGNVDAAFLTAVEEQVVPADTAVIIYTSGSTAEPKAVVHSHGSVVRQGWALSQFMHIERGDRMISSMPFFWVGGLSVALVGGGLKGVASVCPLSGKPEHLLEAFKRWEPTRISLWQPQVAILKDRPELAEGFKRIKPHSASQRAVFGLVPKELAPNSLGMTETLGPHSTEFDAPVEPRNKGTFGRAISDNDRKIVNPETGRDLPLGEVGALALRGGALMLGMYKKERSEVFDKDGFYYTDDLCKLNEEGHLFLVGRRSDMVKTNGSNVSPREVEGIILRDPQLREAVVLGLPDPHIGEVLVAAIVPVAGVTVDEEALRARLRAELSTYKVPKHFVFLSNDEIPRGVSTKIRKPELKDIVAEKLRGRL